MKKSPFPSLFLVGIFCVIALPVAAETITAQDVFDLTNVARIKNGKAPFSWDATLSDVAREKLDDMFTRQYFAHKDPDGKSVGARAIAHHYEYSLLGENLAMGWYEDADMLVDAWMTSSGHRKNILLERFTAIGVALDTRHYQGEETLIAIQVFARPSSVCPKPSMELRTAIFTGQSYAKRLSDLMSVYIKETTGASRRSVRALTNQVSAVMTVFLRQLDERVRAYNAQVETFEKCVREG